MTSDNVVKKGRGLWRSVVLAAALGVPVAAAAAEAPADYSARIARILDRTPLIDGHNDWPEALAEKAGDARWTMNLDRLDAKSYDTDIERLRLGRVGGQFWSVYVSAELSGLEQVKATLDQIGLVKNIVGRYPESFAFARTAADIRRIHKSGRIASLIGVEGGGQIDGSFSVLRAYHELGAGYLTLTHSRTISWADSATDTPKHGGLTPFGIEVVRELNRLGMLVDLSHVSEDTMLDAIAASRAPVIFSHSGARAVTDHSRNASDAVLRKVAANGGIMMVDFAPNYISEARRKWSADYAAEKARNYAPPFGGLYIGDPDGAKAALDAWLKQNPRPSGTLNDVADHIDHIVKVAGIDHVGLGGDHDGVSDLPEGLDGVDTYPALFAELMRRGWKDDAIAKLAGGNILRVMEGAEAVAKAMAGETPATATVTALDGGE